LNQSLLMIDDIKRGYVNEQQ